MVLISISSVPDGQEVEMNAWAKGTSLQILCMQSSSCQNLGTVSTSVATVF